MVLLVHPFQVFLHEKCLLNFYIVIQPLALIWKGIHDSLQIMNFFAHHV